MMLDAGSSLHISCKISDQSLPSQSNSSSKISSFKAAPTEVSVQSNLRDFKDLGVDELCPVTSGRSNDVLSLKSKGSSSLSSVPSADHISSSVGQHYVSRDTYSQMDNAPAVPTKIYEATCSVSNGICDLKTSVRRVVKQFKPSQILRSYPSAFRNDLSGKYKMLFPYDLFVKLYNCNKVELRPCGLTNCGNSCYANAVLQCLAFTRPLTSYLLQGLHTKTCPKRDWCFTCEFECLLLKAKEGRSPLSPIEILSRIHNIGSPLGYGREEDAHEFLRYAIDAMQSACLKEAGANAVGLLAEETTLIQQIFGGYLCSKIKCMRCRGKSERHERMMDLTVEIHGDIGTLEEALSRFTATEILDGENKYQCNRCNSYERAKKELTILEAPNVLTIALKRFQSGKFGKLNKAVRFPEYLDLAPYMSGTGDKSPLYRLYGVVVHQGIMNAAFSGHYVCYVKSTQKRWYKLDDSKVKPVELERVLSKNAYMLLYARCSPRGPSMLRNAMSQQHARNKSRCSEAARASGMTSSTTSTASPPGSSAAHRDRLQPPSGVSDERFFFRIADSSSDKSSLFSCSDEDSWCTESTRDSSSTDELSEYIFGGSGRFSSNGSLGFSGDTDGSALSPFHSKHSPSSCEPRRSGTWASDTSSSGREDGQPPGSEGRPSFLCLDPNDHRCRKLTEKIRKIESDFANPYEVNLMRRCAAGERSGHTFC